ncbi:MAG TPA: Rrf2 family transcriptional regulator [Rhizomicrobium sp.]|nr:Rrf2 family transcriptional regulator [Rhizomicrobium sp.]
MRYDTRLSDVLHVLLHMAQHEGPLTSEALAGAMSTNPVVVRRTLAGLRDQGYVRSEKGHGGGWVLARSLSDITLRDIYQALGSPALCAMGQRSASPDCLVEKAVNKALGGAFDEAQALLSSRFAQITLAQLADDFRKGMGAHKHARNCAVEH